MTTLQLLSWITAALVLQVGVASAIAVWRRRGWRPPPSGPGPATAEEPRHEAGWQRFRVVQRDYEDAAGTQLSFYLAPVDGQPLPDFRPGQFLTFSLPVGPGAEEGRTTTRCYSLSDRPDPARYRVTIKRVTAPADRPDVSPGLSSGHFHDAVQVGDELRIRAPSGRFFMDPDSMVPVVLIAGGIGITPIMSMLRWCLAERPGRPIHLYYGVRNGREQAFKRQIEELAATHAEVHLHVVYSRPGEGDVQGRDFQHRGHVDVDLLRRTLPHGRHQFYVCGPPTMMQTLVPAIADWGVPLADLHYEAFGPASVRLPGAEVLTGVPATPPVEVRFRRSGRTLTWDGSDATLLDFSERHGIALDSGCRSGGCGTCETRLVEGTVLYEHAPDHEITPGHCLMCVGRPASSIVLEA
ncbi:MAG: 2Fe-2S iron-sulfur cluster-binding protein [Steroidobacteraceae bacterium]